MNTKRKAFVITMMIHEEAHFLVREEIDKITKEPVGIFSRDLMDAKKFLSKEQAEIWASGYQGARVERITEGEVLK